jgi:UDP-GlcNAc:undecaprenyl-phosphate/decaprenyl-phosphate GlcNAc-1-phosphate transferase
MKIVERLTVVNHRGMAVPAVLGFPLLIGGVISVIAIGLVGSLTAGGAVASGAALMVLGAGVVDDMAPAGPRGLRGHLAALARGQVTTGMVKLVVIAGASVATVAAGARPGMLVRLSGVVLVAGATNLWNGLDVRPGRALKWFLLVAASGAVWMPQAGPFAIGVALVAVPVLLPDLREFAMLGDAGANLLGFTAGVAIYVRSPGSWVPFEAAAVVGFNVIVDTISLSRVIEAVAPLRWFDRLGTVPGPAEGRPTERRSDA